MCHRYMDHFFSLKGGRSLVRQEDTITAVASGLTNSGISVIRISGASAIAVADRIFVSKSIPSLQEVESHTVHYGYIQDGEEVIDEVLLLVLRAPRTYTREDVVEIDCHGGTLVTRRVLETVLKHGARLAEPGEFTKRAFLNGRIDLSQAEGVMNLIDASNRLAMKHSVGQLRGTLRDKLVKLREVLLEDVSYIEAALDDPEHIDVDGYRRTLEAHTKELLLEAEELLRGYHNGKLIREGINTVILGKPNVGKSTLLNLFAGEERAIVTDIAGTTRDLLEVAVLFDGIQLNLTDTAGLRSTEDVVEKIGVTRAKECAEQADLILYLVDGQQPVEEEEWDYIDSLDSNRVILLINKCDIRGEKEKKSAEEGLKEKRGKQRPWMTTIEISAKTKLGMDGLKQAIRDKCFSGMNPDGETLYLANERQKEALTEAVGNLRNAKKSIEDNMAEDFISIDLMGAYQALGKILGETLDEDLVNNIFEKFCMGK